MRTRRSGFLLMAVLAVLLLGAASWWQFSDRGESGTQEAAPAPALAIAFLGGEPNFLRGGTTLVRDPFGDVYELQTGDDLGPVAISADATRLAALHSSEGSALLVTYDVASGDREFELALDRQTHGVWALLWGPDARVVALVGDQVDFVDTQTGSVASASLASGGPLSGSHLGSVEWGEHGLLILGYHEVALMDPAGDIVWSLPQHDLESVYANLAISHLLSPRKLVLYGIPHASTDDTLGEFVCITLDVSTGDIDEDKDCLPNSSVLCPPVTDRDAVSRQQAAIGRQPPACVEFVLVEGRSGYDLELHLHVDGMESAILHVPEVSSVPRPDPAWLSVGSPHHR